MQSRKLSDLERPQTGTRIRERRQALEIKQADLAGAVGISASYLNLIEHNKRAIGGKLLNDIARALQLDPAALTEGPEASLYAALCASAATQTGADAAAETDRIDALTARFPGWAATIAGQQRQISALEALNDALRDRLGHDHVLADAMHEVLSTASAIRATAAILAEDSAIDPQWLARFHRNLHEEAERLADRATALSKHFEADQGHRARPEFGAAEAVEHFFDLSDHHFPAIEAKGTSTIAGLMASAGPLDPTARRAAETALADYAADAARLPLGPFSAAARAANFTPEPLYAMAGGDVALVLRRLAALPLETGAPEFGLAICDASGALLRQRRHPGFAVPRFADGCPLWPVYRALSRPLTPERGVIEMPDGAVFQTWSISQPVAAISETGEPVLQATMLLRQDEAGFGTPVGPGCSFCTRPACPARRSPHLAG